MKSFAKPLAVFAVLSAIGGSESFAENDILPVPGEVVTAANADRYGHLLGPSIRWALGRGLRMPVVESRPIPLEPERLRATEKYSAQVRLSDDKMKIENFVAGLPFPALDPNDPDLAVKLMFNYENRILVDDLDVRHFECDTGAIFPDKPMRVEKHF